MVQQVCSLVTCCSYFNYDIGSCWLSFEFYDLQIYHVIFPIPVILYYVLRGCDVRSLQGSADYYSLSRMYVCQHTRT